VPTSPDAAAVVATSCCPVVVVPRTTPPPGAAEGPVVLAVAPWTGEDVVELAFDEASGQQAPLLAVRAWTEPGLDLGRRWPDPTAEWDRADERAHRELDLALAPWRAGHPEVSVRSVAVQDGAADLLVALSHRARLLVLGRSTRGAWLGGIATSPMTALLEAARCPVLVVPFEGPPRATWLPGRERGGAATAR
jgi:nucleotide-binding universal stress UspA family protein